VNFDLKTTYLKFEHLYYTIEDNMMFSSLSQNGLKISDTDEGSSQPGQQPTIETADEGSSQPGQQPTVKTADKGSSQTGQQPTAETADEGSSQTGQQPTINH
jgi:hypothetical protein